MRDDLVQRALRQKQMAVDAGRELANVAGAQQQLVADDFGFGGDLPQRGDEKFAPEHCFYGEICNCSVSRSWATSDK